MAKNSKNISIYGHLFKDHIYYLPGFPKENTATTADVLDERYGGTDNFIRHFVHINKVVVKRFEIPATAVIIVNRKNGSRSSMAYWEPAPQNIFRLASGCVWAHFMYADKMDIPIDFLKKLKDRKVIISVDLCIKNHDNKCKNYLRGVFKYTDYLIASDAEIVDLKKEVKLCKNTVIHYADKIVINNRVYKNHNYSKRVKNTLGAGDFFAAELVSAMLDGKSLIKAASRAAKQSALFVKGKINE
jgi:sugar/nucleoside kinase (ribokinase family)